MKIKNISILCMMSIIVSVFVSINALAYSGNLTPEEAVIKTDGKVLIDEADILNESEEEELITKLEDIKSKHDFDLVILTVNSIADYDYFDITSFADDTFDYNGYGNNTEGGMIFVLSMGSRDWAISTYASGIDTFTDAGQEYITDKVIPYLSDGDYKEAFDKFISLSDEFLIQADKGRPYDVGNMPKEPMSLIWFLLAPIIGILLSFTIAGVKKSALKNVRRAISAKNYVSAEGISFVEKYENIVSSNITSRIIPKQTSSSGGGSGGSSVHRSSSGRSHGGSRGKF